jgi:SH3 domain-containing YSC84-like protein 1
MKKILLLSLVGLFAAAGARAADTRADMVLRVQSCEAVLEDIMGNPATAIPPEVWRQARGVLILNQFKAGFLFGFKGGYGVLMVRRSDGTWSLPVLVTANEASVGLQLGAQSVETVCIFTDDATPRLLFNHRFNIGVDAKAVAGPKAADVQRDSGVILSAPVLVYTRSTGLYAGATVKAGIVARNDDANFVLYDTDYTMPELLYSNWVQPPPAVQPLMSYVSSLAGH